VSSERIAIIGLAGRFPGADSLDEFWRLVRDGLISVRHFSEEELLKEPGATALLGNDAYVPVEGVIRGVELFDADFFDVAPREAERMDPQLRWSLQCAWHALEDAGHAPGRSAGRVGVFMASSTGQYLGLETPSLETALAPDLSAAIAADPDFIATMISYKLGLTGPSVTVRTACSSSLVAVHYAAQSLLAGECDMALAGGVSIRGSRFPGYLYSPGGILSSDGRCRPFDAAANGTVPGNGVGVIVMRRLRDALAAGDRIAAVVLGSAVNNDGASRAGFTAPGLEGQVSVVSEALRFAEVEPTSVRYVEAHGTGTSVGDPIELAALKEVFGERREDSLCAIGGCKANIGHLNTAAGIAGLIKAVLAISHQTVPPLAGFSSANPKLRLDESPFYVPTQAIPWRSANGARRAGVSSFGIGGTNAHVVLEAAPPVDKSARNATSELLVVSAKTPAALERTSDGLRRWLEQQPEEDLASVGHTLRVGRKPFVRRRALVSSTILDAAELLGRRPPHADAQTLAPAHAPSVAFVFPGQGSQYAGMAHAVAERFPEADEEVRQGCETLRALTGVDIEQPLLSTARHDGKDLLAEPAVGQPALFIVMHALAALLRRLGVHPAALVGHSLGEYVAATLAGVFDYETALRIVAARGRLQQGCPPGAMVAALARAEEVERLLPPGAVVAALNSERQTVLSGPREAIEELERRLDDAQVPHSRLATAHAFHSALIEPMLAPLRAELNAVERRPPSIPIASTLSGDWIRPEEAVDPEYWVAQTREPVRFREAIRTVASSGSWVFLEVGPGHALGHCVRDSLSEQDTFVVSCLARREEAEEGDRAFLAALGELWVRGVELDLAALAPGDAPLRVALPGYPFEEQPFWLSRTPLAANEPGPIGNRAPAPAGSALYRVEWTESLEASAGRPLPGQPCLLVADAEWERAVRETLAGLGWEVTTLVVDDGIPDLEQALARVDMARYDLRVLHAVGLAEQSAGVGAVARSTSSLLDLTRALARTGTRAEIVALSCGAFALSPEERELPAQASILGVCRVIPQEYPGLSCRLVDLPANAARTDREEALAALGRNLAAETQPSVLAFRRGWFHASLRPARVDGEAAAPRSVLRTGGVYALTGAASGVGFEIARWLAERHTAHLLLLDFTLEGTRLGPRLDQGRREILGGSAASVTELEVPLDAPGQLRAALAEARAQLGGAIDGLFYAARVDDERGRSLIEETENELLITHFAAKPAGLSVVSRALDGLGVNLFVVCSSLSTWLGGIGSAAYAAANCALDAFVGSKAADGGARWVAIDWDAWRLDDDQDASRPLDEFAMSPDEALAALDRVLATLDEPRVVVARGDLFDRLRQWVVLPNVRTNGGASDRLASPAHPRSADSVAERLLALWHEILGVDIEDLSASFFELGGHSLLAVQLLARVREAFAVEVSLAEFFDAPTVAGLAAAIASATEGRRRGPSSLTTVPREAFRVPRAPAVASSVTEASTAPMATRADAAPPRQLEFSLYFFPSDDRRRGPARYDLLLECARFADEYGFRAMWIPERHFHEFGGSFPSPSIAAAAIASLTSRVELRAGSVVLPLHNPVAVAEQWAMVDNLSKGRVGISFASGWNRRDFVLSPTSYDERRAVMVESIEVVRRLWRGETVFLTGPEGTHEPVILHPAPVQSELPVWLTAAGSPETFRTAGSLGGGVLTHLVGQEPSELAERIQIYRSAWDEAGHGPGRGTVTLMVHTYVDEDLASARRTVQAPFCQYLASFLDVMSTGSRSGTEKGASRTDVEHAAIRGFERYFGADSLMGTPETAAEFVRRLERLGVDEVACLVDFGVEPHAVLRSLERLHGLRHVLTTREKPIHV
jgi:natural product biosynthesis luciferase-like monooxygenase protein